MNAETRVPHNTGVNPENRITCMKWLSGMRLRYAFLITPGVIALVNQDVLNLNGIPDGYRISMPFHYFTIFINVIMPRTAIGNDKIYDARGALFFSNYFYFLSSESLFGWITLTYHVIKARPLKLIGDNPKRLIACIVVVIGSLIFRIPLTDNPGALYDDYIDPLGLCFVREAIWIAIGFYFLTNFALNVFSGLDRLSRD